MKVADAKEWGKFFLMCNSVRAGKTTAMAKACKEKNAIMLCRNKQEADRVAREYGIRTMAIFEDPRGVRELILPDPDAVGVMICSLAKENDELKERLDKAVERVKRVKAAVDHSS